MIGLLNIDKPHDVTSREVVNHVQRLVRPHKAGHAGTLDPLATGVLVVCVGQATRLNEFIQHVEKRYTGTFQLGRRSDTEDTEGEVVELENPPHPSEAEIQECLRQFRGEIMQRPPIFSALKVRGQRAYALARRGEAVSLAARRVTIHRLEVISYRYPELVLDVTCSSGTYIRSLGRDIGESMGSAAVMSGLRRTEIGPFVLEKACSVRDLSLQTIESYLLPASMAVEHFPRIEVSSDEIAELGHGRYIAGSFPSGAELAAALDSHGDLIALLSRAPEGGLKPHRVFARPKK